MSLLARVCQHHDDTPDGSMQPPLSSFKNPEPTKIPDYNDWPNTIGFTVSSEQRTPVDLTVRGHIPSYACGVLYRTGPGGYQTDTHGGRKYSVTHWFDGFAQVHRFGILSPTRVTYNSRRTCDGLVSHIQRTGQLPAAGFSFGERRDPCQSLFRKFASVFRARADLRRDDDPSAVNVSVTISADLPGFPRGRLHTKTDANVLQCLDADTLEPMGVANQTVLHPALSGPLSAAHSRTDPVTGDVFNYNLTLGRTPVYRIFSVSRAAGRTSVLATITDAPASYIHSFWLTPAHVVLCCYSAHYALGGLKILWTKNMLDALDAFRADTTPAVWYVIPRSAPHTPRRYTGRGFFAFHTCNAWVSPSGGSIVAEAITYDSLDVLKKFYLYNLLSSSPAALRYVDRGKGCLTRFRIPLACGEDTVRELWRGDVAMELPSINPVFGGRENRYTYGLLNRGKSTLLDGIGKWDARAGGGWRVWECAGHTPGEAVFVADPEGSEEDDGVLLSVVLDGTKGGRSYLLCLDARTMKEVARAEVDGVVALGFHGTFVGAAGKAWGVEC